MTEALILSILLVVAYVFVRISERYKVLPHYNLDRNLHILYDIAHKAVRAVEQMKRTDPELRGEKALESAIDIFVAIAESQGFDISTVAIEGMIEWAVGVYNTSIDIRDHSYITTSMFDEVEVREL